MDTWPQHPGSMKLEEQVKFEVLNKHIKNLWNNWDIRVFVLSSLAVQILLIFFAVIRKRTSNKLLILFTWSLYLLADWVADFALGLLANSQGNEESDCGPAGVKIMASSSAGSKRSGEAGANASLRAFWAPFLLLHLGGPDTITAFAMEDNELWLRHLLGLVFEVGAAIYVFLLSLPHNHLWIPTILIFIPGIVKYGERTYALYLGSMDGFRDSMLGESDPGPNYAKLMEEYQSKQDVGIPAVIDIGPEPEETEKSPVVEILTKVEAAKKASKLFSTFKGLIVELMFSFHDRTQSRSEFLCWGADDAFRVIEFELEFVYEILFTKGAFAFVHKKRAYLRRLLCSCCIASAFVVFFFSSKHEHDPLDVAISYTLLGGAIALDSLALFMLATSDMTLVDLSHAAPRIEPVASWIIEWHPRQRWSESTAQYNLIRFCLPPHQSYVGRIADRPTCCGKTSQALGLQKALNRVTMGMTEDTCNEFQYTSYVPVSAEMKKFIFQQLKKKSTVLTDLKAARGVSAFRGSWVLEQRGYLELFRDAIEADFDESLLVWHIATTLCYYDDEIEDVVPITASVHRRLSKQISDYIIYLLIMQSAMMSSTAVVGRIRFRDTCAEAKLFLLRRMSDEDRATSNWIRALLECGEAVEERIEELMKKACHLLLSVNTEAKPIDVKGDRSKSVLFDGCILAKNLKKELQVGTRWMIMAEVWVEMLGHAAGKCNGIHHAQRLSKGGELLTFVWFLTAHLGLGDQYRIVAGHKRAKLVVGK